MRRERKVNVGKKITKGDGTDCMSCASSKNEAAISLTTYNASLLKASR